MDLSTPKPKQKARHSIAGTLDADPQKRRRSFLNLHIPDSTWKGSLTHLQLPSLFLTPPDGEQGRKFSFGLRRHSHNTLHQTESMLSLCYCSLATYINEDNLQGLQSFLESKQVQVDDKDENGTTSLILAASKGKVAFVRELLSHGADPNAEDGDLWSALLCASKEGHVDVCYELLEHGADIEHKDMGLWTSLMWATYKGRTEVVSLLLDKGAEVNSYGNFHISSLLWAAGRGYTTIVQHLISNGAKVNVGDKYGTTALIWACRKGYTEIVDSLLRAGASVDTAGMYSWTALLVATQGNHVEVVNLLLEHKPNVNALDKDGCSSLTIACKDGYYEIATALMSSGAYINIQDRAGDTNLIHAVKGGHRAVVEALLKKYADLNICGKDRKTALYVAVEKNNVPILKLLLNANSDIEVATKDGDTALLKSVRSRNAEMVQMLLDKKAKITATDKKGDTALHIAMRARSKHIIEILLRNPKHGHLLYKPNRAGETPYGIDIGHQKPLLGQIFGARRINTNEDNENMLGYDLYSSTLADILSEPSLSMPITVGLYAKWGSGKSFLINKLKEEMKNFTREWADPVFRFTGFLFLIVVHIATIVGVIVGLSFQNWIIGLSITIVFIVFAYIFFIALWFATKKYDSYRTYNLNVWVTRRLNNIKLVLQIMFCHPPQVSANDGISAQPIKFHFTDQTRVSATIAGENSVVQMIGSLYDAIEEDYGSVATRLYRAFRPKPGKTSSWTWRKFCCLPYIVVFEMVFICLLLGICTLTTYLCYRTSVYEANPTDLLTSYIIMIVTALIVGIVAVANLYTWNKMFVSLLFSQRRQLQRTISKLDTLKSEGFLQVLKHEVVLMKNMVKCLDSLTSQQKRLVVIVDGLDSCEQDKVLLVLDAVHLLFSDANCPFVIILAIDPHIIAKAVEVNSRRLFNESNIGGHRYLNNMVHLPFYLQNSGLRKVKVAQQTAIAHRKMTGTTWNEIDDNVNMAGNSLLVRSLSSRRLSSESALMSSQEKLKFAVRKGSRKLKLSESVASSIASNLNKAVGPQDLTKMLLTDDYFSDVNPRSMRRLMNVVCIIGRLMNSFQIEFNWYRLASWINITEQWPFRTSWIIHHFDNYEDSLEDSTPLKSLYEKVRPFIPSLKDVEPLLELDRDERKFEIFLSFHRSSLLVSDLKIFLPFTINLDPYLKKVIKEETQGMDDEGIVMNTVRNSCASPRNMVNMGWNTMNEWSPPQPSNMVNPNRGPKVFMRQPLGMPPPTVVYPGNTCLMNWSHHSYPLGPITELSPEILECKLSTLNVDGVCKLLNKIEDLGTTSINKYKTVLSENNINGRVLLHCDLGELKTLLGMSFGDWEMFRIMIVSLREHEMTTVLKQNETKNLKPSIKQQNSMPLRERKASLPKMNTSLAEKEKMQVDGNVGISKKHSVIEKQVTLEDQMICGALQTLNEEACEDVMEETEINEFRLPEVEIPLTSVIPPSPENQDVKNMRSRANSSAGIGETDFVLLQSSGYMNWQPISISVQGNAETLSDNSPRDSPQPPSPVSNRQRKMNLVSLNRERRNSRHVLSMEENGKLERPTTLYNSRDKFLRNRSKSIDIAHRHLNRTKVDFVKLKDHVFQSIDNVTDNSDTESTPLVSQISTPITSPEYKSSSTSPIPFLKRYPNEESKEDGVNLCVLSPTMSLNNDVLGDTCLQDSTPSTSWYQKSYDKFRTMSECADGSVFNALDEAGVAESNSSLFSKYSHSCGQLYRQQSFDMEDISDVHCDPESRV